MGGWEKTHRREGWDQNDKAGGKAGEEHSHLKVRGHGPEDTLHTHTPAQAGRKEDLLPLALITIVLRRPQGPVTKAL